MSTITTRLSTYLELLNETDTERRATLVADVFTPGGRWIDPPFEAVGHDAVAATVGGVQAQFAGHTFRAAGLPDSHHDVVRAGWELVAPDGTVALSGIDVIDLDAEGRFARVVGFFSAPPAG